MAASMPAAADVIVTSHTALPTTRLYPPRLRLKLVRRPRLVSVLASDHDRRLTLVSAPAGYGKSTLVAQWMAEESARAAWVTLSEGSDNDPRAFFGLMVAAVRSIDRKIVAELDAQLAVQSPMSVNQIVDTLTEKLSATTRPFFLVIDDYHVIDHPEIHRAMESMLQKLPIKMRVVLISRSEPPLRLARLRAGGEILELGREDLQFTQAEAIQLFQECLGLDLTPSDAGTLWERNEGWVAGLQLVGVALRGQARDRVRQFVEEFAGNSRFGHEYLWEEVLRQESEEVQSFLLRTSILDRFTAELCEVVTETSNGEAMLRPVHTLAT